MRVLITGHKGYIGAVAGAMFQAAGHDVIGLDTDLFGGCEFGQPASEIPEIRKDIRNVTTAPEGLVSCIFATSTVPCCAYSTLLRARSTMRLAMSARPKKTA